MKDIRCFFISLLLLFLSGMMFGSCDWSAPGASGGNANNINKVYQEGYEKGYKDGRNHAGRDERTDYRGMSKTRYCEGYRLGYQQGYQATESERVADNRIQQSAFSIQKSFGHQSYDYQFLIKDGQVSWSMKSGGQEKKGSFRCNKKTPVDVISDEIRGLVLWHLAGVCLSSVDGSSSYDNNLHFRWGKETLMQSAHLFNQVQDYCPNSSKLPRQCLNELYAVNEDDPIAVATTAISISHTISSEKPETCDLAGCDL